MPYLAIFCPYFANPNNASSVEQGLLFPPAMVRRVAHPETADTGAASLHGHKVAMPLPPTQGNKKVR